MDDLLFYQLDLYATIANHERALGDEVNSLSENEVLNTSQEDLVRYLVAKYRFDVPHIDEDNIRADYGDAKIDVSGDFRRFIRDRSRPFHISGTRITFNVPFSGDPDLFKCQPSRRSLSPPRATVGKDQLTFTYELTAEELSQVGDRFDRDLSATQDHLGYVVADVSGFNSGLRENAGSKIDARRAKLLQDREIVASLRFPLQRAKETPSTFVTPDVKRRPPPRKPVASPGQFSPEPELGMEDYEHILSVLSNMVTVMERSPGAFKSMKEEDLRWQFLVQLNGHYEGRATGETFNAEGKTDILIREEGKNIFIAECKFWTGPKGLTQALDQLLGYTTWRDTKAALLVFNRGRNMSTVLDGVSRAAENHPNYKAARGTGLETQFRYVFGHRDDPNREIIVTFLVFDVPT